jgi:glyoxylase-like metal-dependent hydrolase (beta-lactamase superfamily II)
VKFTLNLPKKIAQKLSIFLKPTETKTTLLARLNFKNLTEAEIGHSNALKFKYGEHNLAEGDTLNVGSIKIKVLYTPGHTNESLCYVAKLFGK